MICYVATWNGSPLASTLGDSGHHQSMFDALVCFLVQRRAWSAKGSTLLRLLNQHFYAAAAQQFERWDKTSLDPNTGEKSITSRPEAPPLGRTPAV